MSDLTPIPAEQRRAYYDALLAGRDEAARLGYGLIDDRIFAAFHRALYRPMLDAHEAEVRAKVAEEIEARLVCCDIHNRIVAAMPDTAAVARLMERGSGYHAICHWGGAAAAIARGDATRMPQIAQDATEPRPVRDLTSGSAETRTAGFGTTKTNNAHEEN